MILFKSFSQRWNLWSGDCLAVSRGIVRPSQNSHPARDSITVVAFSAITARQSPPSAARLRMEDFFGKTGTRQTRAECGIKFIRPSFVPSSAWQSWNVGRNGAFALIFSSAFCLPRFHPSFHDECPSA